MHTGWCIWVCCVFPTFGIYTTRPGKKGHWVVYMVFLCFASVWDIHHPGGQNQFFELFLLEHRSDFLPFWACSYPHGLPGLQGLRADLSILSRRFLGPLARAGAACPPWDSHSCHKCTGFAGLSGQLGVHVPRVLFASCSYDMTSACIIGRCRVVLSNMKFGATTALMLALGKRAASKQISATPASQK